MTRDATLNLDEFSREALERLAGSAGGSPSRAVQLAVMYYLSERDAQRRTWPIPRLPSTAGEAYGVHVELDDATWGAFSREADEQGVSPELLAVHAMLYLLADIDSGRLVGRLESAIYDVHT